MYPTLKKIIDLKNELRKHYSDAKLIELYQAIEQLEKKVTEFVLVEELQEK